MVAFVAGSATHIHDGVETKSSLCSLSRSATALLAHSPLSCILPCVLILDVCFVENHDMMLDVVYFLCHALLALRACAAASHNADRKRFDETKPPPPPPSSPPRTQPGRLPKTPHVPLAIHSSVLILRFGLLYLFQLLDCTNSSWPTYHLQHPKNSTKRRIQTPLYRHRMEPFPSQPTSPSLPSTALDT